MFFASLKMMLLPLVAMKRCLPLNVAKPRIIRRSRHHWRSQHHLPKANIIEKSTSFEVLFSGGGRWIRTTEGSASRFTVCPLWPLGNSPIYIGAGDRTRTNNLLITNQLHCHCATPAHITCNGQYYITKPCVCQEVFRNFLKKYFWREVLR